MLRNIPNKYTRDMILDEINGYKDFKKKYDFFYLPIDYRVISLLFRINAMLVMLSSTSFTLNSLSNSTKSFISRNGRSSILKKYVRFAMRGFKEQLSYLIISRIQTSFSRKTRK